MKVSPLTHTMKSDHALGRLTMACSVSVRSTVGWEGSGDVAEWE